MKYLKLLISISFLLGAIKVAQAAPSVAAFGVKQGSKAWKVQELEEWFKWKIAKDISQFINPELFNVFVEVEMMDGRNTIRRVSNVELAMFGTVAKLVQQTKREPSKGLFGSIHKLDITLVAAESISPSTIQSMETIIRKNIPLVKSEKVQVAVVRFDPPSLGVLGWIRELKGVLGALLIFGLLFYVVNQIMKQVKFTGSFNVGAEPVSEEGVQILPTPVNMNNKFASEKTLQPEGPIAGLVPLELIGQGYELADEVETEDMPDDNMPESLLEETEVALELRKIRSLLLSMSVDECVNVCKADPFLGAVATTLLTPEKATRVTTRLVPDERKKVVAATMEWNSAKVAEESKSIVENIRKFKFAKSDIEKGNERLSVYLDQVGPEGEEKVFDELLEKGRNADFAWLVRDALPTALIGHVPDELISSVLTHISYEDQVELLAFSPEEMSKRIWKLMPKSSLKVKSLIEGDVSKKQSEVQFGDPVSHSSLGILMSVVRKALEQTLNGIKKLRPLSRSGFLLERKVLRGRKMIQRLSFLFAFFFAFQVPANETAPSIDNVSDSKLEVEKVTVRKSQLHVRTGLIMGAYSGTFEGEFTVPLAVDIDYELFVHNDDAVLFRFIQGLDDPDSIPFYTYAGMGYRYYWKSKGPTTIQKGDGIFIESVPKLRFYVGFDVGISQVLVKSFGVNVQSVSNMADAGGNVGAIYQISKDFGAELQAGFSLGYGISSTPVNGNTQRFLGGMSYFF